MDTRLEDFAADILEDDGHAAGRTKLRGELDEMKHRLKQMMDKGVTPEEANSIQLIRQAVDSAMMIVDRVWESKYN